MFFFLQLSWGAKPRRNDKSTSYPNYYSHSHFDTTAELYIAIRKHEQGDVTKDVGRASKHVQSGTSLQGPFRKHFARPDSVWACLCV